MSLAPTLKLIDEAKEFDERLARRIAQYAVDHNSDDPESYHPLLLRCFHQEDLDGARAALDTYRGCIGEDDLYHQYEGVLHFFHGDRAAAIKSFENALSVQWRPDSASELGLQYLLTGNRKEAIKHCRNVIELSNKHTNYYDLASYLLFLAEPSPAYIQHLRNTIAHNPKYFARDVYWLIATRVHRAIDRAENKATFERMIRLSKSPVKRPKTYIFPDDESDQLCVNQGVWIRKVASGHGGQDAQLVSAPAQIAASPEHIVQEYITNPYLIHDKKFHVRMQFAITDLHKDEIYLYRDGLVRFAPEPFTEEFENSKRHITNTIIHGIELDDGGGVLHQNLQKRLVWTFREFIKYMDEYHDVGGLEERFCEQVKHVTNVLRLESGVLDEVKDDLSIIPPIYLGVDMLLDANLNVWVLELQVRPALHGAWPMDEFVVGFFNHLFELAHARPAHGRVDDTNWTRI